MQDHATASRRIRLVIPIRAAIYARVSSDQQAERHTINSQVEALLARASADGHKIQAELRFLDDGQSGASLIRPALERLRDLTAMAAIDVVYVHAPDRLARSYAHQVVLVEEFARASAEIVFFNRPIGQTLEDTLLLQLQSMFTEYERARIIERSGRGKHHLAKAGAVSVLGRAPYGYRFVSRAAGDGVARFEVVENEGAVVRRIFQWIGQERASLAIVCQRLFEAGVPSPTEGPLAAQHDFGAAHQPRLCRPSPFREVCHGTLTTAAATAARSWLDPQAPVSPLPGPTGTVDRHPGLSADRRCAVREHAGAIGQEPAAPSLAPAGRALPAPRPTGLPSLQLRAVRPLEGVPACDGAGIQLLSLHRDG